MDKTTNQTMRVKANSNSDKIIIINASDITPKSIEWLWPNILAKGKLHVFAGVPGTAKTTIALDFAAKISRGGNWPDNIPAPCGQIIIWTGEDDIDDTLMPRLIAAGANPANIRFIGETENKRGGKRAFNPSIDMPLLEQHISADTCLIIIDPLMSMVQGESNSNGEVRKSLQPLIDLGVKRGLAIVGITHFSKGSKGRTLLDRVTGSLAFGAAARIVMVVEKVEGQDNKYVFAVAKANICDDNTGFYYSIEELELPGHPGLYTTKIEWGEELKCDVHEFLVNNRIKPKKHSAIEEAKEFLLLELTFKSAEIKYIEAMAKSRGISFATLKRARKDLGITSKRIGFGEDSTHYVSLSDNHTIKTYQ